MDSVVLARVLATLTAVGEAEITGENRVRQPAFDHFCNCEMDNGREFADPKFHEANGPGTWLIVVCRMV